ncbi:MULTISPECIES: hypothetical protein [Brachybacterium]|uniref:Uncharacterized protein n=2 Tax=Brachybacterium TaxID=43668 RepID=A0A3R8RP70_9MICO|nr:MULTISPECIES: hypothetical protein [Brachybacterium]RRR18321.1 hypothetical protein DS079_11305 [Brachybacterium paraconglomeratum]GLI30438.1 hypothetical protein BCONGLO52_12790 [Brachybacterium conglomeratum]GLK04977.1 hypothetical protein GCM10017597_17770 [Brachybacterium conglomeratum]
MTITISIDSRKLDILGIMSTTAGGLGVALTVWAQLARQELYSFYVFNGHGTADSLLLIPFIPGLICAILALWLGVVSLRRRYNGRTWAILGLVAGTIAVAFMVSGVPVALVPDPRIPQGPL